MASHRLWNVPLRWQVPAALVLTGLLIGACVTMGILQYVDGSPLGSNWANAQQSVLDVNQSPLMQANTNSSDAVGTSDPADPADLDPATDAKLVKPLTDLVAGDRVIYAGQICQWRGWGSSMSSSMVACGDGQAVATQTYRLTPVELKNP
jgi:hypothetical protein